MLFLEILLLFLGVVQSQKNDLDLIVNTPLGDIRGSIMKTRLGKDIFAFRGIRYAKAPVNDLRFQPPVPVEPWTEVLDATNDSIACPQPWGRSSEDCLMLNVYSTSLKNGNKNPKRPVIVFFHAGGFYGVSGQSYYEGPDYLMDKEIVLVVPNYRLGALGFISTGDKEAPGNNGLKDQVLVLQWVKQNIESFGGDPNLVTISGYSAGAFSVCLHMISPMSKGLFHRAIAMSASCTSQWKLPSNQMHLAKKQAQLLNCPDTNSTDIIKCLKSRPAQEIADTFSQFQEFGRNPILIWSPVVEPDLGQERFVIDDPNKLYIEEKYEKIPFMAGISEYEFVYPAFEIVNNETLSKEINENFQEIAPIVFQYERNTEKSKTVSRELKKFYFGNATINNETLTSLAELVADSVIGFGVNRMIQLVARTNNHPVYYYMFSYKGRVSHFYIPGTNNTVYGAVHHDELIYLFHPDYFPLFNESDPESKIVDYMTTMWTNFAKTGKPTPEDPNVWVPTTIANQKYLNIDTNLKMKENLYRNRYNKWNLLFPLSL